MRSLEQSHTPTAIRHELIQATEQLMEAIRSEHSTFDDLERLRQMLESLLLTTDEYSTASNRLRNAHRYLTSDEPGAARYELRLLAGSLRCVASIPMRERCQENPDRLDDFRLISRISAG